MRKVLLVLMCLSLLVPSVYAEHGKMKGGHGDFDQKFCQKAMMIVKNQEELGLSDAQVKKVKDLKMSTKKDLIRKNAEIEILALDIKSALWEDEVDLNAINTLIDKKYDLKKEKTKSLVAAYVSLKGMLTKEQQKTLKGLCGKGMKGKRGKK